MAGNTTDFKDALGSCFANDSGKSIFRVDQQRDRVIIGAGAPDEELVVTDCDADGNATIAARVDSANSARQAALATSAVSSEMRTEFDDFATLTRANANSSEVILTSGGQGSASTSVLSTGRAISSVRNTEDEGASIVAGEAGTLDRSAIFFTRSDGNATGFFLGDRIFWSVPLESSAFNVVSDKTLKKNIKDVSRWDVFGKLKGYSYSFTQEHIDSVELCANGTDDPKRTRVEALHRERTGPLAQEVQQLFPQHVYENNEGVLSVDMAGMLGEVLTVIPEMIARIKALEAK